MREIKFRAWQDNQMVTQPLSSIYAAARFFGFLYEDAKLMQYTGLKDKNGKEIYEGDILEAQIEYAPDYIDNPIKGHIMWGTYCAGFVLCQGEKTVATFRGGGGFSPPSIQESNGVDFISNPSNIIKGDLNAEIIGNIYENPELLEQSC